MSGPVHAPYEAVAWEVRRKNRYNGEWTDWWRVGETTEAQVRAEPGTPQNEWEFRTLYTLGICASKGSDRATTPPVPYDKHEREVLEVIDQRDHREEIINQLCDAVLGVDRSEWSSGYHFENAVIEVRERMASLEAKQQGPGEAVVSVEHRSGHERWCSAKEGAGCSCDYVPERKEYTHSDPPQVEAKRQTGEGADHG